MKKVRSSKTLKSGELHVELTTLRETSTLICEPRRDGESGGRQQAGRGMDRENGVMEIPEKTRSQTATHLASSRWLRAGKRGSNLYRWPWIKTAPTPLWSMAALDLLTCRTRRRRRKVNMSGAKVHRRSLLKPRSNFPSTVPKRASASRGSLASNRRGQHFKLPTPLRSCWLQSVRANQSRS